MATFCETKCGSARVMHSLGFLKRPPGIGRLHIRVLSSTQKQTFCFQPPHFGLFCTLYLTFSSYPEFFFIFFTSLLHENFSFAPNNIWRVYNTCFEI